MIGYFEKLPYISYDNMTSLVRIGLFFLLLIANEYSYGQEKMATEYPNHAVWRKRVVRSIYIASGGESAIKDTGNWKAFFTSLVGVVVKGKVAVYHSFDLTGKIGTKALKEKFATHRDTMEIFDPVASEKKTKIISTDFDFANISQFKICEEWVFDPLTKKTTIRINGVAPAQDIFDDINNYQKTENLFWIEWDDFQKYANDYQDFDILYELGARIWNDYQATETTVVAADMEPEKETVWKTKILRKTHLYSDTALGYEPNLTKGYDSSIAQILYNATKTGKINAYSDEGYELGPKLSLEEFEEISKMPPDTVHMGNTLTGSNPIIIAYPPYCFGCITKYYVHEKWKYSYSTGIAEISYVNIAPVRDFAFAHEQGKECIIDDEVNIITPELLYWFDYNDASKTLTRYNEYNHPSIEFQLWQDRFREKKHEPIIQK